jgi:hypothetical protein
VLRVLARSETVAARLRTSRRVSSAKIGLIDAH